MAKLKRKVKKRLIRFTVLTLFLFVIVFSAVHFWDLKNNNQNRTLPKIINPSKDEEKYPKEYNLSLLATGDGLIHNQLARYAQTGNTYDFKPYLTEVKDIVQSYDLAYYNQETPFGTPGNYSFYPTFAVPSEYGDAMLDAGFNLISLASNHSFDKRETGVLNTLNYYQSKDNIMYNGIADSYENQENYQIAEKNGITYALLSYTYGTNGITVPDSKKYLVSVYSNELAQKDIKALRDKVDVLIVAMHWGVEYQLEPTSTQKEQAKFLADLGVDIIIGNHPHCLQPIEWLDDTLVIYSLGNFISNQIELYNSIGYKGAVGAFAMLDIKKTVNEDQSSKINLENLKVDLLFTYRNETDQYYKVVPFSKMDSKYLKNYQSVYEDYKKVIQKYDQTINVVPTT